MGCAGSFSVAVLCCVVVVDGGVCYGVLCMSGFSLRYVNGGGVLIYSVPLRDQAGAKLF